MSKGDTPWTAHHEWYGLAIFAAGFIGFFYVRSHLWAKFCLGACLTGVAFQAEGIIVEYLKNWKGYAGVGPIHRGFYYVLDWLIPKTPEGSWLRRLVVWLRSI